MKTKNTAEVISLGDHRIQVEHDGELIISLGKSRYETKWQNKTMRWSALLARLSRSIQTGETHAEYMKMAKEKQDQIKDIGGFVGGHLKEGKRKNGYVAARQILTLDADFPPVDFWDQLVDNFDLDFGFAAYSTHKHTPQSPRLRLIVPLDREVTPDEYEAIARKIAEKIGIDYFDDSTFQPARLMFWPSHSADVEPFFDHIDGPFLCADAVLAEYPDWTDVSYWPMSSRAAELKKPSGPAADPLSKRGIVGAFCRTYSITAAIEKFLSDIYTPTAKEGRYTYAAGSTAGGLVIYNDDTFAYSNHSTDPAKDHSCNAFDLVRIHLFGELDDGTDKTGTALPSYREMAAFAKEDPEVVATIVAEQRETAAEDFAEPLDGKKPDSWKKLMHVGEKGIVADSWNAELILKYDERISTIRYNEMSRRIDAGKVPWERPAGPWRDADDARLYQWIVQNYKVQFPSERFHIALTAVADERRYHPVKEYLEGLPAWDGTERIETLLIDYLGAQDNTYTREAMKCCLTAAVARIYQPGIKFDSVLILWGPQAIGKTMLFDRLGGDWYSDNLSLSDMKDKTAAEKLQGYWILEMSELNGMRKTEVETVKGFISRRDDVYRAAYGRNTESRLRQCVIVGTTNDDTGFLRDVTGNRRFWPIRVTGECERHPWDLTEADIGQIWAEAKAAYEMGDSLLLTSQAAAMAADAQRDAMETDDRQGLVEAYLDRRLPANWDSMDYDRRMMFLDSDEEGEVERKTVSNIEIWVEALHNPAKSMEPKDARAITAIMARLPEWGKSSDRKRIAGYGLQRIYKREA